METRSARCEASDEEELLTAIYNVRNVMTADHCRNYIGRVNRNCQRCVDGVDYFEN